MSSNTLTPELLHRMDAYWRAANYLAVGQMYLCDNPLLKRPLTLADVKRMLLGHWGTTPGRPLKTADVVRGQYAGYRKEPDVARTSDVETFCAVRLFIDSWRWEGGRSSLEDPPSGPSLQARELGAQGGGRAHRGGRWLA